MQSTLFGYMGNCSILCAIGNLNGDKLYGFSTADFIFKRKEIIGWHVFKYFSTLSEEQANQIKNEVQTSIASGDKTFLSNIAGEFPLDNFEEALKNYRLKMSKGKIILKP
jgi:NADPH:quinone reductase-like Zn-dependent oxidoreductase